MKKVLYQIDEVGKVLLLALRDHGKHRTFSQILDEGKVSWSKETQVEAAIVLEALHLIESVTYRLPLEIRAELTPTGKAIADRLYKYSKRTKRSLPGNICTVKVGNRRPFNLRAA